MDSRSGDSYLGAGTLLLGAVVVLSALRAPCPSQWWAVIRRRLPLIAALLFLAAMAVGPVVTAGSQVLATYDARWWGPLTVFRSHGRMIWALHYAQVAAIVFAATRFAPRTAVALLAVAVAVQSVDVAGMRHDLHSPNDFGFRDPLVSPFWTVAAPHFERLVLVPSNLCDRNGALDYRAFGLLAGRHGLAVNAGSASRHDARRAAEYCQAMAQELREGLAQSGTLYVVRPDLLPEVRSTSAPRGTECRVVDGFGVCFAHAGTEASREQAGLGREAPDVR